MTIAFRSSSTSVNATTLSRTVSEPAGAAEDDLLIALVTFEESALTDGSFNTPSGWTELADNVTSFGGANNVVGLYYRVRGASSVGDTTWTYTGSTGASYMRATIAAYSGVDPTTPLDVTYANGSHYVEYIDNGVGAAAAITSVTDNAMVLLLQKLNLNTITTPGAPSGYTLDVSLNTLVRQLHFFASKTVATAGTETPGVWTHSGVGGSIDSATFTVALRPAAAAVSLEPDVSPLYYGATLLANKTNIQYSVTTGHGTIDGEIIASGIAGTTDASGNFVIPAAITTGAVNDPVTLHLYWEEGSSPVVDRSLIVKTMLVATA